ncbi:peptide chain release factor N(5)-glutamine methyltransferase [Anaerotalea alkaliphila]|uniref:Release factor glutamine methyltransferase n=1 Tax=Anaerotalea alkaliphila TaxID=2662126 RepID=A0A7X5HYA0_9FIRM|nr:peptide chain release factor N(5)-glutamine methyltransferase [Anaerotalea alkaliphila]NDL68830.1 peptide chain release factor N(5)-glutamine methyltransferase [Anaerotalea alkaliphila]
MSGKHKTGHEQLRDLLQWGRSLLEEADKDGREARLLLEAATGLTHVEILVDPTRPVSRSMAEEYERNIWRRTAGEPLQQILGTADFMGFEFHVDKHVLIPRPETEELVEWALETIREEGAVRILDMCTGSGCIPVSLGLLQDGLKLHGADLSWDALEVAGGNASKHRVEVSFHQGDLFDALKGTDVEAFDLILSNPPYIESETLKELMPEVVGHEPRMALDGGPDGLAFYRRIARDARKWLKEGGWLFLEIGWNQEEAVRKILEKEGYVQITPRKDLAGHWRMVRARSADDKEVLV